MTRTRSQAAQAAVDEPKPAKSGGSKTQAKQNSIVLDFGLAASSQKISKQPKNLQNSDQQKKSGSTTNADQITKPVTKGNGLRGRPPKPVIKSKESLGMDDQKNSDNAYNTELVQLNLIKKFDIDAVIDQTGNSNGDSHLPRATLNQIIRESLPVDVRAQKDTMDLICFISNAFIDLLSDVSNNVCYKYKKKNIVPEHVVRGLQHLNLDEYIPFMLTDDQNMSLSELLKSEKKKNAECKGEGIHQFSQKQIINVDNQQGIREQIVGQMVKRLQNQQLTGMRKRPKKPSKKVWTSQEIEDQRRFFQELGQESLDSEYGGEEDGVTSNESPSLANAQHQDNQIYSNTAGGQNGEFQDAYAQQPQIDPQQQQWTQDDYRFSWINHNRALLDQDYVNWAKNHVDQYIEYVATNPHEAQNYITDHDQFMQAYPLEYFYDLQYNEYIQSCEQQEQQQTELQYQPDDQGVIQAQEAQAPVEEQQMAENGFSNEQLEQNQQCDPSTDQIAASGTLATTAEGSNTNSLGISQTQPILPALTPANSLISPRSRPDNQNKLAQATSSAIAYNVIKPDQAKPNPGKKVQEATMGAADDDINFDDMDD